ncbi:MAG: RtcB family protein, partial [Planctomycetes bacterium]|nr:RtcB family protein [Planctomycetota bacterium]
SACHGAGRVMSRTQAVKRAGRRSIVRELREKGIVVQASSRETIAEEMPEAYKDVSDVVEAVHEAGLARKVARLRPLAVIKG